MTKKKKKEYTLILLILLFFLLLFLLCSFGFLKDSWLCRLGKLPEPPEPIVIKQYTLDIRIDKFSKEGTGWNEAATDIQSLFAGEHFGVWAVLANETDITGKEITLYFNNIPIAISTTDENGKVLFPNILTRDPYLAGTDVLMGDNILKIRYGNLTDSSGLEVLTAPSLIANFDITMEDRYAGGEVFFGITFDNTGEDDFSEVEVIDANVIVDPTATVINSCTNTGFITALQEGGLWGSQGALVVGQSITKESGKILIADCLGELDTIEVNFTIKARGDYDSETITKEGSITLVFIRQEPAVVESFSIGDTYISSLRPTENYGSDDHLDAGLDISIDPGGDFREAVIRFPLPTSHVNSALLHIYQSSNHEGDLIHLDLREIVESDIPSPWDEMTLTWENSEESTKPRNALYGVFDVDSAPRWHTLHITAAVNNAIDRGQTHFSLVFSDAGGTLKTVSFNSREADENKPYIEVTGSGFSIFPFGPKGDIVIFIIIILIIYIIYAQKKKK